MKALLLVLAVSGCATVCTNPEERASHVGVVLECKTTVNDLRKPVVKCTVLTGTGTKVVTYRRCG